MRLSLPAWYNGGRSCFVEEESLMFTSHSTCSRVGAACGVGLTALLVVVSSSALATPVSDVLGDAVTGSFRTYDITQIDATFTTTHITFTISLTNAAIAPSVNSSTANSTQHRTRQAPPRSLAASPMCPLPSHSAMPC